MATEAVWIAAKKFSEEEKSEYKSFMEKEADLRGN